MSALGSILRNSGRPLTISWSAIETFDHGRGGCNRKWWYGYMEGRRSSSPATILGGQVHDVAEDYLNGKDIDWTSRAARIFAPGIDLIPLPEDIAADGWIVEEGWTAKDLIACGPLPFAGRVDFGNIAQQVVCDFKTSGASGRDPNTGDYYATWKYSKSTKQLANHGQPLLYAKALWLGRTPPATVSFQHVNLFTKGKPEGMEVWARDVPWSRVEEMWTEAEQISTQMAALATNHTTADTLESNVKSCKAFGGCPHASYCTASPINRNTKTTRETTTMSTTDPATIAKQAALRAKMGIPPLKTVAPAAKPTPAPTAPPRTEVPVDTNGLAKATALCNTILNAMGQVPEGLMTDAAKQHGVEVFEVMQELGLRKSGPYFVPKEEKANTEGLDATTAAIAKELEIAKSEPAPEPEPAPPAPKVGGDIDQRVAAAIVAALPKTPGGAMSLTVAANIVRRVDSSVQRMRSKRWEAIAAASNGTLAIQGKKIALVGELAEYLPAADAPQDTPEPEPAPELNVEVVKAQLAERATDLAAQLAEVEPAPEVAGVPVPNDTPPSPAERARPVLPATLCPVVYIDAMPLKEDYTDFSQWVAPFEDEAAEENGVVHYSQHGFGKGRASVVGKVKAYLHANGPNGLPSALVVGSAHPLAFEITPLFERVPGVRFVKGMK